MRYTALGLISILTLVLAACGGSADSGGTDTTVSQPALTTQPEGPATTAASENPDTTADAGSNAESSGINTAVITVGEHTYEFEWGTDGLQMCNPDFFGAFVAVSAATSDVDSFEADFPPPDDPELITPRIEVSDRQNDIHWTADPEETIGTRVDEWPAQVDSYQINGTTVSGTATFVDSRELTEGVPGSFEITCVPED